MQPSVARQKTSFYLAVGLVLGLGVALRFWHLEQYPLAANQDELSNFYDGYSIAQTGADRWGQLHPLMLRGFGALDYRPPMYAWLCAGTIRLFGFSVFAGRLVAAGLGSASLVLLFAVAHRLGGRLFAFFALLLAAFSPWHILYSRIGSEGAMLPPFFLIGACCLWQWTARGEFAPKRLALLGLWIGLGTSTYQAGKLVFLLFALLVLFDLGRRWGGAAPGFWVRAVAFGGGCLAGAGPQLLVALTQPQQFFARANGSLMPFAWSGQYFVDLIRHVALNLSPKFLFFSFGHHDNLSVARLLAVEVVAFYVGVWVLPRIIAKNQVIKPLYVYLLGLFVILPSALTTDNPHALRTSGLVVLAPLLTAAGLTFGYRALANVRYRQAFLIATIVLITGNFAAYAGKYSRSVSLRNQGMQALLVAACQRLGQHAQGHDQVFFEREAVDRGEQDYIYLITYLPMPPADFQRAPKVQAPADWDHFKRLDKYYFLSRTEITARLKSDSTQGKVLLLLRQRNPAYQLLDSVRVDGASLYFQENTPASLPE